MASPTEASPPSAAWPNKDVVPQESLMNLMDGSADHIVLPNKPRTYVHRHGSRDTWGIVGGLQIKNLNTTKREHRSSRGSKFKRKIRAEVEKAQTEDRKGSLLSVNLHHKTPWPLAAIKDLREVLMRWGPPTNHTVSHTYISFLLLLGILRLETERDMLALFACSPGFIRSDAASALLDARWKYRR